MHQSHYTFSVDDALQQAFNQAAAQQHLDAASLLRGFMRKFIKQHPKPKPHPKPMNDVWGYKFITFRMGANMFNALETIAEYTRDNIKTMLPYEDSRTYTQSITGIIGYTSIVMSYTLLENFFFEEYKNYFEQEPKKLVDNIIDLMEFHNVELDKWNDMFEKLELLRKIRNCVVHKNGYIDDHLLKQYSQLFTPVDCSEVVIRLSLDNSIHLISEMKSIVTEYSEKVFFKKEDTL